MKSVFCSFKANGFSFSSLKAHSFRLLKEKWDVEFIYTLDVQREKKGGGGERNYFHVFFQKLQERAV